MKSIIATRKGCLFEIIVDDDDYTSVSKFHWGINSNGYVLRWFNKYPRQEYLHHAIIGKPKKGFVVDHINRNKLDNRRCNLRIISHAENLSNVGIGRHNKSGIKGVCFCKQTGKWAASFKNKGKKFWLGRFNSKEAAAIAYNEAVTKHSNGIAYIN